MEYEPLTERERAYWNETSSLPPSAAARDFASHTGPREPRLMCRLDAVVKLSSSSSLLDGVEATATFLAPQLYPQLFFWPSFTCFDGPCPMEDCVALIGNAPSKTQHPHTTDMVARFQLSQQLQGHTGDVSCNSSEAMTVALKRLLSIGSKPLGSPPGRPAEALTVVSVSRWDRANLGSTGQF